MTTLPPSDEVAAHQYRLAQANRVARYCRSLGIDPQAVLDGELEIDLDPISNDAGLIVPEDADFRDVG